MNINKTRLKGFVFVILSILIYSGQSIIARSVLIAGFHPMLLAALKLISGFITLSVMIVFMRKKLYFDKKDLPVWLVFAVCGGTFFAITMANSFNLLGASQGVIYLYTAPAFTVIIAHFYLKERINRNKMIAVILVLLGTVAVAAGAGGSSFDFNLTGFLYGIASGVTYGIFSVLGKKLSPKYGTWNMNFFYLLFASIAVSPTLAFFNWSQLIANDLNLIFWVFIYGSLIYGFGNLLFLKSMQYLEAGEVMIFANFEPVLSVILATLILKENLMPLQTFGFIFILIAIFLIAKNDKDYISLEG